MIEEKLQKCRVALQEMKLKKTGLNKYTKIRYFELSDFLPQVNLIFHENKIFSNFSLCGEMATLTITDTEDKSCQVFTSNLADAELKGCTAVQSLGAVHTYLKRYLYMNALEITEDDSLDANIGNEEVLTSNKKLTSSSGIIGQTEKEILKETIGAAKFAKEMNACNAKMTFDKYYELLENSEQPQTDIF